MSVYLKADTVPDAWTQIMGYLLRQQHGKCFRDCHTVEKWLRTLLQDPSPDAALIRQRAVPLIEQDPTRMPGPPH